MLLGRTVDTHKATDIVDYKLVQNNVVGMGSHDGVFSFTIWKCTNGEMKKRIIDGIKNKEAAYMIWEDIKEGKQK